MPRLRPATAGPQPDVVTGSVPTGKPVTRIDEGHGTHCQRVATPATINAGSPDGKWSEGPVKAQFFQVVLGDLDKFCFDFYLGRLFAHGRVDERLDEVEVGGGIANDQAAASGNKVGAGSRRELDSLGLQKILGVLPRGQPRAGGLRFPAAGKDGGVSRTRRTVWVMKPGGTLNSRCSRVSVGSESGTMDTAKGSTLTLRPASVAT